MITNKNNIKLWKKCLILIGISLIGFGLYITFFKNTSFFALFANLIDPVFWTNETISEGTLNFKGFIYSFSGTYVLLWGIHFLFLSKYALTPGNRWAWNCLALSTSLWFIIMVPFSFYYKVYYNVFGDILFFILISIPLLKVRKFVYTEIADIVN